MGYLNNAGLSYLFGKLKTIFAPINHGHGGATQSAAGFMSVADKKKLDGITEGANKYTLPTATSSVLGGVKTGANITNSSGTISMTKANVTGALGYEPPTENTWRDVVDNLTSTATDKSLSAAQGKVLNDSKVSVRSWETTIQCATWCRLCYVAAGSITVGSSFILNIGATRNSVIYNDTFVIKAHHSAKAMITKISGCNYSSIQLRVVSDVNGRCYVELYDAANGATKATAQNVYCRLISIFNGPVTWYTTVTDGTTLPTGFTVNATITTNKNSLQGNLTWGEITEKPSTSDLINSLSVATAMPTDEDYYVCQYAGGGTTTTTYHRRSMHALWAYIKSKGDSIYQAKGNYYDSTTSRTKGTVLAAPSGADGAATFRVLTKSDVGLGSVDNTADSAKSVKYATSAGSATKATNDAKDQAITGYIRNLSVNGQTVTFTKGDGTTGTITTQDTNTTYSVFARATADAAGSTGLVPAPAKGDQAKVLRGDCTWATLNYAGSSSVGGAATSANKVNSTLTILLNGTSQGAWNGSGAKSINVTAASVGATSVTIRRW